MKLINEISLSRGKILMEYALSGRDRSMSLEPADLIGITAAYIASGNATVEIEEKLSDLLGAAIAADVARTFTVFNDWKGRGLWNQGPAMEDVEFSHIKLSRFYPHVASPFAHRLGLSSEQMKRSADWM